MFGMLTGLIRLILSFVYLEPECGQSDTRPSIVKNVIYIYLKLNLSYYKCLLFK